MPIIMGVQGSERPLVAPHGPQTLRRAISNGKEKETNRTVFRVMNSKMKFLLGYQEAEILIPNDPKERKGRRDAFPPKMTAAPKCICWVMESTLRLQAPNLCSH